MSAKRPSSEIPTLSEMEWEVMKPLWKHGPLAARDIFEKVPDEYSWAYETVKSMVTRLVKKGAIEYDQVGNSFLYRAAYSRKEITRAATGFFIRRVFDEGLSPFFAQFIEEASGEEIALLKSELARKEKEISKRKGERS